jgi:succinate-semialdehyde dehydrogenase/glutarate-semialdehyde dehydrogenase
VKYPHSAVYGCWVHGGWMDGDENYAVIDPSNGELLAQATAADAGVVDSAFSSACEGFGIWRRLAAGERAGMMHTLAELIRGEIEPLAATLCSEVGKPLNAARDEVLSAAALIDYFAEEGLRLTGRLPLMGYEREHVLIVREPVGVVAAITPFNYPLSTLACKLGAALAAGCSLVAKPDEHTPLSTLQVSRLATEAGMPAGVFNVVTGPGPTTGRLLVEHPVPRLITFTGSTEVGREIQRQSARYLRKVILELGGHCPAIVCRDAPWSDILPQLVRQSFKNSGQYCYRISRIYVDESIHDPFLRAFARQAASLRIGRPTDKDVDLGPLNNEEIVAKVRLQVKTAVREGAQVVLGGELDGAARSGFYYRPTILRGVGPEMSVMHEEVFGPVVIVSPFKDLDAAVQAANSTPFGLAAYLFTGDLGRAFEAAGRLEAGSVWINRIHQAYPEAPFGGMKESGLGREKSLFGIEEFTELKTVYLSY